MAEAPPPSATYPVTFEMEYPERMSRWSTFFRGLLCMILVIPISYALFMLMALSALPAIAWVSIMTNGRYPRLLFPIAVWVQRLNAQLTAYVFLVTDEFPFDERDRPVKFDIVYAVPHRRLGAFFMPILVFPHVIVLLLIGLLHSLVTLIAWFAILLTGNFPKGLWDFSVGYQRWNARVAAYSSFLTDRYPPFSFS